MATKIAKSTDANDTKQALRFHGKGDLRLEKIPSPICGKGQVKIKPMFCGICGTDLHEYLGGPNLCPAAAAHPLTGETVPLTFGHEFSGVIEEVGEGCKLGHKVGGRVAVQPIIYDGTCGACNIGLINCCYSYGFVGLSGWGGGLSDYIVLPEHMAIPMPDNVPMEVGALIEPLAVGWHAVKASPFKEGDSVLVLGGGPIGLAVIQAVKAKNPRQVIVSEISTKRQEFARHFGADVIVNPMKEDLVARCRELCDGEGVHVVFDAAGVQAALTTGVEALRAKGTFMAIAVWEKPAQIYPSAFLFKERTYKGIATYVKGDFEEVLQAISEGKMKPESMITKRINMHEVEEQGFKTLINDNANHVKVLVEMDGAKRELP